MSSPTTTVTLEEVKKNIRALLISAPRGLSVDDIEHDYRAMLGKPLPYKLFKCRNCLDFLKTIPDVVSPSWVNGTLILRGIADSSTRHIAKLVSRQKVSRTSRRVFKPQISTKPLVVPSYFQSNIKELLSCYPNGVLGSALNSAYARHYCENINYAKLGFRSMSHLLDSIKDIATIVKDGRGGFRVCATVGRKKSSSQDTKQQDAKLYKLFPATPNRYTNNIPCRKQTTDLTSLEDEVTKKNEKNIDKVKNLLDSKSGVSDELKEDLILVLTKRPNGVWAARLPFEFKTLFNKELPILSLGFYSVIELVSSLPDVFRIERPFANSDWLLFLSEKYKKDKNITKIYLPENGVDKGTSYCQLTMPETESIGLYITHIKSPGYFWVQLIEHYALLVELETEIRKFYDSKESVEFLMVDCLVKLGQVCAARFPVDRLWYRALITKAETLNKVDVYYVDYGNSSQVAKSDLRVMKKEFIQLPVQALTSKLANIKPKSTGKWDPVAAHRLNDLTFNKPLYGVVCDTKDGVLSLCICDTTSKVDIHVNDVLVDEGFAEIQQVVNDRFSPPVLPPVSQAIPETTTNQIFPDYYLSYNLYNGFSNYDIPVATIPIAEPCEQPLSVAPEQKIPALVEEKPSDEDLEFMRQVCEELSDGVNGSKTVKRLNLSRDKFIHLINYQGKPYVVRSEVSALLWESDLLRTMLRQKKMVVAKEVIAREDHEALFNELKGQKVGDFDDSEDVKEFASLYELSVIPGILETFKHPSTELVQKVKEEKATFDANPAAYWTETKGEGNNSSETDDSCQSESEEELDLEELQLALQALQFRRKRILRAMVKGELTQGENTVDEVDEVEKQIASIHELILKAEVKDQMKDVEDTKDNKGTEDKEGTSSNKETDGKKDSVSTCTVDQDSTVIQEVKPTSSETIVVCQNPSPTPNQPALISNEEKPNEKLLPTKPEQPVDRQEHYRHVVQTAQRTIKHLGQSTSRNPIEFVPPKFQLRVDAKPEKNPCRATPLNVNRHVSAPHQPMLRVPAFLNPPQLPFPPFPQPNHLLQRLPFPGGGFIGQLHQINPPFPDFAVPPAGPYHAPCLLGQSPPHHMFFPWGQNPIGSPSMLGEPIQGRRAR